MNGFSLLSSQRETRSQTEVTIRYRKQIQGLKFRRKGTDRTIFEISVNEVVEVEKVGEYHGEVEEAVSTVRDTSTLLQYRSRTLISIAF